MLFRQGRRILAITPQGRLEHEIRLTCADGSWQARVVTLPNQIWVEPGANKALCFEAPTADLAEEMAIAFVQADCIARGQRIADPSTAVSAAARHEPARRLVATYPLRFSLQGPLLSEMPMGLGRGATANLSETGLFITAGRILPPTSLMTIDLRLPGLLERLEGEVIWVRSKAGAGLLSGMGIRLIEPPLSYRARIQSLR